MYSILYKLYGFLPHSFPISSITSHSMVMVLGKFNGFFTSLSLFYGHYRLKCIGMELTSSLYIIHCSRCLLLKKWTKTKSVRPIYLNFGFTSTNTVLIYLVTVLIGRTTSFYSQFPVSYECIKQQS